MVSDRGKWAIACIRAVSGLAIPGVLGGFLLFGAPCAPRVPDYLKV